MYETEQLIFVQMQKTGSTHIAKILAEIFKGPPSKRRQGEALSGNREPTQQRQNNFIINSQSMGLVRLSLGFRLQRKRGPEESRRRKQ